MSANTDRRVNRTKLALRRALLELIAKGDYDAISIQDIVNQADIGRSTFYAHYADKEDLLLENMAALVDHLRSQIRHDAGIHPALAFGRPTLEHVAQVRPMFVALLSTPGTRVVRDRFQQTLGELVAESLPKFPGTRDLPSAVVVDFVTSSFIVVARWWVIDAPSRSLSEVHRVFIRLVSPTLEAYE